MIVNYWPDWFRSLYGGEWPRTYCAIDCETTGYAVDRDVIWEWGHVLVVDGTVQSEMSLVIDWTNHPVVLDHWLRTRLDALRQGMALNGAMCHATYEGLKKGMKPAKALAFIRDFTRTLKEKGILFVAHNGTFDEKMLSANLIGFGVDSKGFSFGDNGWIDTECVEKANQCPLNERMHPRRGDTLREYWHRVRYTRVSGVKSNLAEHCYTKYDLAARGVNKDTMHGALTDARCTHYLMEEFGKRLIPGELPPPVFPTADHKASRAGKPIVAAAPGPARPAKRYRGQRRGW